LVTEVFSVSSEKDARRDGLRGTIYADTVWTWDPVNMVYITVSIIEPLRGYWVFADSEMDVTVEGQASASTQRELLFGWNLCGPSVDMVIPGAWDLRGPAWQWNPATAGYQSADAMLSGLGYWLNVGVDRTVDLGGER